MLFQMGRRLTDSVRLVSGGLIGKLKTLRVSSVKCSPVSLTDTHVCFEYLWVLCCLLEERKKALTMSSFLFSTWAGWTQSWWRYKWDAVSTEVSCFLCLFILCDFFVSLFWYLVMESHQSWSVYVGFIWAQGTDSPALYLVSSGYMTNAHSPRGFCFASDQLVCMLCVCCCGEAGGLQCAFSPPAETCQSPEGAGPRFTGQLRQPWQPSSSRLERGMPLCRSLAGQDLFPSCHFTSTSPTFN